MNPLQVIADNPALFDALKEHIAKGFDIDLVNYQAVNNEELGQVVRARLSGLGLVDKAFIEIARLKTISSDAGNINPAR